MNEKYLNDNIIIEIGIGVENMKKDFVEFLGFTDEELKGKVGRPKLADKETKKKSILLAVFSFVAVILLLVFGYGTLFGFDKLSLLASVRKNNT